MNPAWLLSNWRAGLIAALVAGNALFYHLWQSEKAEYLQYAAGAYAVAKSAIDDKKAIEADQKHTLEEVKRHEQELPAVRAGAVAAYLAAHRVPVGNGQGAMPGITGGVRPNDGAGKECVPDEAFIRDAADDADKVAQWQEWAIRNHIPLEDNHAR